MLQKGAAGQHAYRLTAHLAFCGGDVFVRRLHLGVGATDPFASRLMAVVRVVEGGAEILQHEALEAAEPVADLWKQPVLVVGTRLGLRRLGLDGGGREFDVVQHALQLVEGLLGVERDMVRDEDLVHPQRKVEDLRSRKGRARGFSAAHDGASRNSDQTRMNHN